MFLYLDTNIYLNFYQFTSDDLEELKKLAIAIASEKVTLLVPEQTKNEYLRKRESKIAESIKQFREEKLSDEFPRICRDYDEYEEMKSAIKNFQLSKANLLTKLEEDINNQTLGADKIIKELFDNATVTPTTETLILKARNRHDLGNPPGKNKSYGDALNWEAALEHVPTGQNFYFITGDQDYLSKIDDSKFNKFLLDEWLFNKKSNLFFYKNLSSFFEKNLPEIQLADEPDKAKAIESLVYSSNFANTKKALRLLDQFSDFSDEEIRKIVDASISNNQIYWIAEDAPVQYYLNKLIKGRTSIIDPENLKIFNNFYNPPEENLQF